MGLVQQAVLDFDEEIQVPWRPRLVAVAGAEQAISGGVSGGVRPSRPRSSGRSSSRVGVCRPVEDRRPAGSSRPSAPSRRPRAVEPARATRRRVRLTRRARLLAVVLTLALGVALGSWLGQLLRSGAGDLQLAGVQNVVVQPGDTLWSIATGVAGTGDVRAVVDRLQRVNHLRSTVLVPGQVIELP